MFRILYRFLASMARLAVRSGRSKELEIIVLRHQLAVLRRRDAGPVITDDDRSLLGAIAQALPRPRTTGWLVTPETLLRWHRRRVARYCTQPHRPPGRPSGKSTDRNRASKDRSEIWTYQKVPLTEAPLTRLWKELAPSALWSDCDSGLAEFFGNGLRVDVVVLTEPG